MLKHLLPVLLLLSAITLKAQTPILDEWQINTTGQKGVYQYYTGGSAANPLNTVNMTDSVSVISVAYDNTWVYVKSDGLAPHSMGPWVGNPNVPAAQNFIFKIPKTAAQQTSTKTSVPLVGGVAVTVTGVVMYGYGDGRSYKFSTNTNTTSGDGLWHGDAWVSEGSTMDATSAGHADGNKSYHYHATPLSLYTDPSTAHSPIIAFALDGYPIYGPYGYTTAMDNTSAIKRIKSSYQIRNITTRVTLPSGVTSSPAGPNVSATFPLGTYIEDYEYLSTSGDLDEYNGRYCVTPEYPSGTYAYFLTTDDSGNPAFPYLFASQYYGIVSTANIGPMSGKATIPGAVTYVTPTPTVTLSASPTTISENGGTSTITATLSAATTSAVTVTLAYSGTATSGSDYTALTTTISIAAGNTTGTKTVTAVDDAVSESSETLVIDIASATNATESGTQQATITITDDDVAATPTVTLSASPATIAENGGASTITATLSAATTSAVTVTLAYSGTATSGSDYSALTTTITIAAGNTTGTKTVTAMDDASTEGDETLIAEISSATNATENGTQAVTITISDDETVTLPTVSFQGASTTSISETGGTYTIGVQLSAATTSAVTVTIGFAGTATGSGTDYTASTTITIPAGGTMAMTTLTAVSDSKDEADETVIIDVLSVTNATENSTQQRTVTITDDDLAPTVTISAASVAIVETGGVSTVTATLSAVSGLEVTINLEFTGTATSGTDYSVSASSITIPAGSTSGSVTITTVDDLASDANETILVDIFSVTNGTAAGTQQVITITELVTGIQNGMVKRVAIYPNPSSGAVQVELEELANEIVVLNSKGMVVESITVPSYTNTIDLTEQATGMYFLQIKTDSGITTKKVDLVR